MNWCEDMIDNYDLAPASWSEDDLRCQEPAVGKYRGRWLCEHHLDMAMDEEVPVDESEPPTSLEDL